MKAYQIQQPIGLEALALVERPVPQPRSNQVLVRVRAASFNSRDVQILHGRYVSTFQYPIVPLSDGVGEVIAVGDAVQRAKVGDRVSGIFRQKWIAGKPTLAIRQSTLGGPLDGFLQEYIVLDEEGVVQVPAHLTDEEAATLPCAAVTAWSELFTQGHLNAGETVLVQGTGGVSLFALQFAKMAGARVILTSRSDEKLERARTLGADDVINTVKTPDWAKRVRELTGGDGVDYIIDVVGDLSQSLQAIASAGQISIVGFLGQQRNVQFDLGQAIVGTVRLQGANVGHRESFEAMNRAVAQHHLHPVIDRTFSFEEAPAAFRYMEQGSYFGKICIRF